MKNTIENKEKFFALYWGQRILKDIHQPLTDFTYVNVFTLMDVRDCQLNLKHCADFNSKNIDSLRLEGFAVPFMNFSVDDLVNLDWIKLIES